MARKAIYSSRYEYHDRTTLGSTVKNNLAPKAEETNRLLRRTATCKPGARYVHLYAANPDRGAERRSHIEAIVARQRELKKENRGRSAL